MNATITDSQFKISREDFFKRLETQNSKNREVQAVYKAHMAKVADCLYLAGEAVKRAEFGYAEFQHHLAGLSIAAAIKCLPAATPATSRPDACHLSR